MAVAVKRSSVKFVRIVLRLVVVVATFGAVLLVPQHFAWSAPETRMTGALSAAPGTTTKVPFPVTHVVVQWNGEATATVQLRGAKDGVWQAWQTVRVDEDGGETQEGGMIVVDDATELQTQVLDGRADNVRVIAIDAENGPRHLKLVSDEPKAQALDGATPQPNIVRRSQWGADESIRKGSPEFSTLR